MARYVQCAVPGGSLRVRMADNFVTRALGLLVGRALESSEGLLIAPCSSIHTLGMRYAIDVVFLDRDARVVRICDAVPAGRARFGRGSHAVLELRAGIAGKMGLRPGARLGELAAVLRA